MKPFAVRYRQDGRYKLSALRLATYRDAQEYALRLMGHGAKACAVVRLEGRKFVGVYPVFRSPPPPRPRTAP